jgi:hypothetical protein
MSENDNQKPTVKLDEHRGLTAQRDTDARRHQSDVRADQETVRQEHQLLEKNLFAGPAATWAEAAEKSTYLLRLFAATGEAQDPRYKQLIENTIADLQRLARAPA